MKEIALFQLIRTVLLNGLAAQGVTGARVKRNYQAVKTSAPVAPTIIMHRIDSQRIGWQSRNFTLSADRGVNTAYQHHAITFQFNALVPPVAPEDETADTLTPSDLLELAAMILQSAPMLVACKAAGIGVQPITGIRSNWVQNENDNWEHEPSFDMIVLVKKALITSVDVVTGTDIKIYPI